MSKLDILNGNLRNLQNNLNVYGQEIDTITNKIKEVVVLLNDTSIALDSPLFDTTLANGVSDLSALENGLLTIANIHVGDEIIDYSVNAANLTQKDTIIINDKQVNLYRSNKTDALYVISNGLTQKERTLLISKLQGYLSKDQMAIITFNGDYYHYDGFNKGACTKDYAVVGKTDKGKMYAFRTGKNTEIVTDDGRIKGSDTLVTSINGMIIGNKMEMLLESDAEINLRVRPQINLGGGQTITEFTRLSFSGGSHDSVGSEYVVVSMDGDWQRYANTRENKQNGTWINENNNKNVVTVGNGPQRSYAAEYKPVGHVDSYVIPVTVRARAINPKVKVVSQHMQGTVCYHYDGNRPGIGSKDMLGYPQLIFSDWQNL